MKEQIPIGAVKAAIFDGLGVVGLDQAQLNRVKGFVSDSDHQLKPAVSNVLMEREPLEVLREFGVVAGRILSLSGIKHPEGKLKNPANVDLLHSLLESGISRPLAYGCHRTEINIGLGGSEQPPSLRIPAYVQPAIDILNAYSGTSRLAMPEVRIFNAHRISSSLNGLNPDIAGRRAEEASALIGHYVETFFPKLKHGIRVEELDPDRDIDQKLFEQDRDLLEDLFLVSSESSLLSEEEKIVLGALEKLKRAAKKHSKQSDADIKRTVAGYAATHAQAFHNYGRMDVPDTAIKLGGQGEVQFDTIQEHLIVMNSRRIYEDGLKSFRMNSPQISINLRLASGSVPPYYPEAGELTVESESHEIPNSLGELKDRYRALGLMCAKDFDHLPREVAEHLPEFFRTHLATRQRQNV